MKGNGAHNDYLIQKMQYRTLHEKIMQCQSEEMLEACVLGVKSALENQSLPYPASEKALETFLFVWKFQHANAQRPMQVPFAVKETVEEPLKEEAAQLPSHIQEVKYSYEMAELLGTSLLMMINIYKTDARPFTFDRLHSKIQKITAIAHEKNGELAPKTCYTRLLAIQTELFLLIGKAKENVTRN